MGIPKQYKGIFDYGVKKIKNDIEVWCEIIPEKEKEIYNSFGKRVIFTNNKTWTSLQIVRTYNSKSLIEDDFKWLNNKIIMPLKPYFVRKDITIKAHVFLCVMGLLLYRFILAELKIENISLKTFVEKLEKIKIAVLWSKNKCAEIVMKEMTQDAAEIFALLRMDRFIPK